MNKTLFLFFFLAAAVLVVAGTETETANKVGIAYEAASGSQKQSSHGGANLSRLDSIIIDQPVDAQEKPKFHFDTDQEAESLEVAKQERVSEKPQKLLGQKSGAKSMELTTAVKQEIPSEDGAKPSETSPRNPTIATASPQQSLTSSSKEARPNPAAFLPSIIICLIVFMIGNFFYILNKKD